MAKQVRDIISGEGEALNIGATISRLPNVDTKMVTKKKFTKELHNLGYLRRMTTRVLKGRDLKLFATTEKRRVTCPGLLIQGNVCGKQCGNI